MNMTPIIAAAFDQRELVDILNAASLALDDRNIKYRLCAAMNYSGAPANPLIHHSNLKSKLKALLALAEESDQISFRSTQTYEDGPETEMTAGRAKDLERLRMTLGIQQQDSTKRKPK